MIRRVKKPAADLKQKNDALKRELRERTAELAQRELALRKSEETLRETLAQQAATADVLRVISGATVDLVTVLQTVAEAAGRLCSAEYAAILRRDGDVYRVATAIAFSPEMKGAARRYQAYLERHPLVPGRGSITGRVALEGRAIHVVDTASDPEYELPATSLGKLRTQLGVPLLREGSPIGVISLGRQRVEPFTERQIEIVRTFADQAVIAIENTRLFTEQRDALAKQTAMAEILGVISRSTANIQPVFDAIVERAAKLCEAEFSAVAEFDGELLHLAALNNLSAREAAAFHSLFPRPPTRDFALGRAIVDAQPVRIEDALAEIGYDLQIREVLQKVANYRSILGIPILRRGKPIGGIFCARREVRPFTQKQLELVSTFADQAVIAMENARLITETREALEQQTATAEVLQIINSLPGDLEPAFAAMLEKATRLCEAGFGTLWLYDGERFSAAAIHGVPVALAEFIREPVPAESSASLLEIVQGSGVVHVPDLAATELYNTGNRVRRAYVDMGGARTLLSVALRKDDRLLGAFNVYRQELRPFSDKQVALVQNFAAQAVIAMENARLLGELRHRTTELARSVDELTATGDVLKIISRSSVDLETVLDTLVETVTRLCRADNTSMFRRRDSLYHLVAAHGISEEAKEFVQTHPFVPDRSTLSGRVMMERRAVHLPDVLQDPEYSYEGQKQVGFRSALGIPLLRGDMLIGIFVVTRTRVEPFTDKEIELATTFADQAVIAIENARLFEELHERQTELRVTFDNMGDGVVMFDGEARLTAWNRNFQELLDLPDAFLAGRPSYAEYFRYLAERGEYVSVDLEEQLSRTVDDTRRELRFERTRPDGRVIEVRRNPVPGGGFVMIYSDITERKRAEEAIRTARDAAETALRELQTAQASLVHAQKMAALGQLTAGIAHEIKNPLNFVNNFAGLSVELLDELKETTAQAIGALDADKRAEIVDTIGMLTANLEKIAEHGRRADGIVRSMLQHSRGGSGDWQASDLNALVEEAVNLAYHGARAQDQTFNITLERDYGRDLAPIDVVPQDMMRVFLNLIGNGFYAADRRRREADGAFRPVLKLTTRDLGEAIEIRVRDNGVGIPREHREKLFQPFFTTKPTGEGTGLGLSISYEIATQQHGGTITVDSEVDEFTEFTVRLPRRPRSAVGRMA